MTSWITKKSAITIFSIAAISITYITHFSSSSEVDTDNKIENSNKIISPKKDSKSSNIDIRNIRRGKAHTPISNINTIGKPSTKTGAENQNINTPYSINKVTETKNTPSDKVLTKTAEVEEKNLAKSIASENKELNDDPATVSSISHLAPDTKIKVATRSIEKVAKINEFEISILRNFESSNVAKQYDYGIYINAFHNTKSKKVYGDVLVYDDVRYKKLKSVKTHTLSGINDPNNRDKSIRLISSIFGYRPQEISFSMDNPNVLDTVTYSEVKALSSSLIEVNLRLERLQPGDIAVMWNVLFYVDAAIMRPESKQEIDELLTMLEENPKMRVMLHGHTNGNSHGKIIHLGTEDNNDLFNISSHNHVETVGSAKKLSLYRAETIHHYLVSNGIDSSRIEIKGWGGKKMVYDKHSTQANQNVRVEVEILKN